MAPCHFFGELTKTPEGCQYLRDKGLVAELAEIVRLHGMESADQAVLTNVKSVLWALVSRQLFQSEIIHRAESAGPYRVKSRRPAVLGGRGDYRGHC